MFRSHPLAVRHAALSCLTFFVTLLALSGLPASAQGPAFLVDDLVPGLVNGDAFPLEDGAPAVAFEPVEFNGRYYFAADHPRFGVELWRSDGTPGGTELVADICLGPCDSYPSDLTVFGGRLYFAADDGVVGRELRMLIPNRNPVLFGDLCPGSCDAFPAEVPAALAVLNDRLIFTADDATGPGLYTSDGRLSDTQRYADLCAGPHVCDAWPRRFLTSDTQAFFVAGPEPGPVWRTDGSADGTREVLSEGAEPRLLGDRLIVLSQSSGGLGQELWSLDGSLGGSSAITDLCPGGCFGAGGVLGELDGRIYFRGRETGNGQLVLYRTDGTAAGTELVVDRQILSDLAAVANGELFFFSGQILGGQPALWATDGTGPGTRQVLDEVVFPENVASAGGLFYFHGEEELWVSDGTPGGTRRLRSWTEPIFDARGLGGRLFFTATTDAFGRELWVSDGTRLGTRLFVDLHRDVASSEPSDLTAISGGVIFETTEGIFTADANAVVPLNAGPLSVSEFHPFQDVLLFCSESRFDAPGLWQTDGTEGGTFRWVDSLFDCSSFAAAGGELFFGANTSLGLPGVELWATDGSVAGTRLVRNINPPSGDLINPDGDSDPGSFVRVGDNVVFAASRRVEGRELWQTDGTEGGTRFLRDLCPGSCSSDPEGLLPVGDVAVFAATDRNGDRELWITDGTPVGTRLIRNLGLRETSGRPHGFTRLGEEIFFFAKRGRSEQLWATDGTPVGTRRVRNLAMNGQPSFASEVVRAGERLFFTVYNRRSGAELWVSDGSGPGTFKVTDIAAERRSADPLGLTAVGERVVFTATDWVSGRELWASDGTASGTFLVQDLEPGAGSSAPGGFALAGDFVFFRATTSANGTELWAVPQSALAPPASVSEDPGS